MDVFTAFDSITDKKIQSTQIIEIKSNWRNQTFLPRSLGNKALLLNASIIGYYRHSSVSLRSHEARQINNYHGRPSQLNTLIHAHFRAQRGGG